MIKNIFYSTMILALMLVSCNDDFLEKPPIGSSSEDTAFENYEHFKTYTWGMYRVFSDYSSITRTINTYRATARGDAYAGHLFFMNNSPNYYASQQATTFASGTASAEYWNYATGGWDFSHIRRVNIMLDNINDSKMTDEDKAHWRSVGYFFHSFLYAELVSRYGDVPWVDRPTTENDPLATASRESRVTIMDKIMDNLLYAEANIYPNGDGTNTINRACVQFLISRLGLFEGTWRKYHNVDDGGAKYNQSKLLQECVRASEALMVTYPQLGAYDELFNSPSLASNPGVILYQEFIGGVLSHFIGRYCRTGANGWEVPKHTVELFLSQNGLPIHNANNTQYAGDKTMFNEFRSRDHRLYANVLPPFYAGSGAFDYALPEAFNTDYDEYVNLLPTIFPASDSKRLPATAFNNIGVVPVSPNIEGIGSAFLKSKTGYTYFRYYNQWEINVPAGVNEADMPIFHMSEVLLNYAEAKFELGKFDQGSADVSINKLRARSGVADMNVATINENFDPKRDPLVPPVLWEIRRERIVEMLGEGCGFDDIRRWKRAPWYINRNVTGCYLRYSDYTEKGSTEVFSGISKNVLLVDENFNDLPKIPTSEGYVKRFVDQSTIGKGWDDKYYLLPLPLEEKALNPNLLPDNPGW